MTTLQKRRVVSANIENWLRESNAPVWCCSEWPECAHVLDWYELYADRRKRKVQVGGGTDERDSSDG